MQRHLDIRNTDARHRVEHHNLQRVFGAAQPGRAPRLFASEREGTAKIFSARRTDRSATFPTPTALAGASVDGVGTFHPTFLPNQLEVIVQSSNALALATRSSSALAFSGPVPIASVNGGGGENLYPFLMPDGTALWFSSSRATTTTVYESVVTGATFGTPAPAALGAAGEDAITPVLADDALTIYFASKRSDGINYEIYRATRLMKSSSWDPPVKVTELNSTAYDAPTWLSPDGCRLYLMSTRTGSQLDLYVATRQP